MIPNKKIIIKRIKIKFYKLFKIKKIIIKREETKFEELAN
jgi:hypothetical protein